MMTGWQRASYYEWKVSWVKERIFVRRRSWSCVLLSEPRLPLNLILFIRFCPLLLQILLLLYLMATDARRWLDTCNEILLLHSIFLSVAWKREGSGCLPWSISPQSVPSIILHFSILSAVSCSSSSNDLIFSFDGCLSWPRILLMIFSDTGGRESTLSGTIGPEDSSLVIGEETTDDGDLFDFITVNLNKKSGKGLGLSVAERADSSGIYISRIIKGGSAEADGRFSEGDFILKIDGVDLSNSSREEATALLKVCSIVNTINNISIRRLLRRSKNKRLNL